MRINHIPSDDETREARRKKYLEHFPVEKQLEALIENAMGRPEKLNRLMQDFTAIREVFSFFSNKKGAK